MLQSPHDRLFKGIFSSTENARQVLRTALPTALTRHIDFRTLRLQDGSFVDESLRMRYSDLLFSARAGGHGIRLYLLFEHQSEPDPLMAYRLLRYMTEIWDQYMKEHARVTRLPAIIPVVLHHGAGGWISSTAFEDLYDLPGDLRDVFASVLPCFNFVLDDLAAQTDDDLRRRAISAIPTLVLWMFKHARQQGKKDAPDEGDGPDEGDDEDDHGAWIIDAMRRDIRDLMIQAFGARTGVHALAMLMRYTLEVTGVQPDTLGRFLKTDIDPNISEVLMTAAERLRKEGFEMGLEKGLEQGLEQGLERGRRAVLVKLLGLRFGPLPTAALSQIEQADIAHLDLWIERVLAATSLSDVLAER